MPELDPSLLVAAATLTSVGVAVWMIRSKPSKSPTGRVSIYDRHAASTAKPHVLELTPTESGICRLADQANGALKVGIAMTLSGPALPVDIVQRAVLALQERHPLLRGRVGKEDGSYVLLYDPAFEIQVEEMSGTHPTIWNAIEKDRIGLGDPILRVIICTTEGDSNTTLFVVCHHAFCDGKSLSNLSRELVDLLDKPNHKLPALPFCHPMEVFAKHTLGMGWFAQLCHALRLIAIFIPVIVSMPSAVHFPTADESFPAKDMSNFCNGVVQHIELDKADTKALIARCRQVGTTVTGVLGSIILDAVGTVSKCDDGSPLVFGCGVDIRGSYVPAITTEQLGYHVSGASAYWCKHKSSRSVDEVWQLAKDFRRTLVESLKRGEPLEIASLISDLSYNKELTYRQSVTVTISNWGVFPMEAKTYGSWELVNTLPYVNMVHRRLPVFFATTFDGRLTVTLAGQTPALDVVDLTFLAEAVRTRLEYMSQ